MEGIAFDEVVDLGQVIHRESKTMDGDTNILIVYDKPDDLVYHIDAYSLSASDTVRQKYKYVEFDSFFRFNAELMNPNKRKERWHWLIERLTFQSDGCGGQKLAVHTEPTETPQVPLTAQMKMPTGRMDYGERAQLRSEMERLDVKRNENIKLRQKASHERFIKQIFEQKELQQVKINARAERIAKEVNERFEMKLKDIQNEKNEQLKRHCNDDRRHDSIEEKLKRRAAVELGETQKLLARQAEEKKADDDAIEAERERKRKFREEVAAVEEKMKQKQADRVAKREKMAKQRDERVQNKTVCLITEAQKKKKDHERWLQSVEEKKLDKCRANWKVRNELFSVAAAREKELAEALQSEKDLAVAEEQEKNTESEAPPSEAKKEKQTAMDVVEEHMRAKIEAAKNNRALEGKRTKLISEKESAKNTKEVEKARSGNDLLEKARIQLQQTQQQRSLARVEEMETAAQAQHRRQATRDRLDKLREARIAEKEALRFQRAIEAN